MFMGEENRRHKYGRLSQVEKGEEENRMGGVDQVRGKQESANGVIGIRGGAEPLLGKKSPKAE